MKARRFVNVVALAFSFLASAAVSEAATAKIFNYEGQVQIRSSESDSWKDVKKNQSVTEGSSILTGANSHCTVGFVEDSKGSVKIQQNSRAVIVSAEPVKVRIEEGRVFAFAKELRKNVNFEVSTLTAIAAARGTGWVQDSKQIAVLDATVHVQSQSGEKMDVSEGKGIELTEDGHFGDTFNVQEGLAAEWRAFQESSQSSLNETLSTSTLSEIDQFDPNEDFLETKDEFYEIKEQEVLQESFNDTVEVVEEEDNQQGGGTEIGI